ncbi:hypothetical protein [Streptomyces tendae]|uniref:hypothetical protein n=1 Tax=Streptomyces tendae TaxID=1932 RepID=UPI0036539FC3
MTTALEADPYLLPLPAPTTPVVPAHLAAPFHAHLNARYADLVWPLAPLTHNPSTAKAAIRWGGCPAGFQSELRLIAWNMINGKLRPTFLKERNTRLRSRIGISCLSETVRHWMCLVKWLHKRGISTLTACDTTVLHDYGQHLLAKHKRSNREYVAQILGALTRLWAFDQLSARPAGIGRPGVGRARGRRLPSRRDPNPRGELRRTACRGDDGALTCLGHARGR